LYLVKEQVLITSVYNSRSKIEFGYSHTTLRLFFLQLVAEEDIEKGYSCFNEFPWKVFNDYFQMMTEKCWWLQRLSFSASDPGIVIKVGEVKMENCCTECAETSLRLFPFTLVRW